MQYAGAAAGLKEGAKLAANESVTYAKGKVAQVGRQGASHRVLQSLPEAGMQI